MLKLVHWLSVSVRRPHNPLELVVVNPLQVDGDAAPDVVVPVQTSSTPITLPCSSWSIAWSRVPSVRSFQSFATTVVPSTSTYGTVAWVSRVAAVSPLTESQALNVPPRPALLARVAQIASAPEVPPKLPF